ncbi:MAG: hypothetical protein KDB22_17855 [Planctomycetales bacterium]|nr:hypothetical protein [Planctomycetales bacterium]
MDESAKELSHARELFSRGDARFVEVLRRVSDLQLLAQFADQWKVDRRSWSTEQKVEYLRGKPNCIGHQTVVKRLFKQAEADGDDAVVAVCAALFDRLVRHVRRTRYHYDWRSRSGWHEEYLAATGPALPRYRGPRVVRDSVTGKQEFVGVARPDAVYFSYRTRYYLQRRAWRYFRRLAFKSPERYVAAAVLLLREYPDSDFQRGEWILDSWTLLQLAFRESQVLQFGRARIRLASGGQLSQLTAAPRFRHLWQSMEAFNQLYDLVGTAPSRLVRVWAMQMLEQDHASRMQARPPTELLQLLVSPDEDVQQFAARFLKEATGIRDIPLATWFELLETAPQSALPIVCEAMKVNVKSDQLSLAECVDLTLREPTPLAELGFSLLRTKQVKTEPEFDQIARLADLRCIALAESVADWALSLVGSKSQYDRDHVSRFFDSLSVGVRQRAWAWLEADDCPGASDPILFCRMLETPFEELRLKVIDLLERRSLPGEAQRGLVAIWTSVLLGVHRGGRQKLKATRQLARELVAYPERADQLLPVLAAAVRSVRQPEARAGLAAVVASLASNANLAQAVSHHLPELEIVSAEALL